ncbi:MAG: AhpC/TSA family protein [Flavobacteriales bacterium]|nr:AhpC/TSA family protein [Flavobacteriales bacterium]
MKKKILILASLLFLAVACANTGAEEVNDLDTDEATDVVGSDKPNTELSGVLNGAVETPVYLQYLTAVKIVNVDTAVTDAEGNFSFKFKVDVAGYYRIGLNDNNICVLIVEPKDKIKVQADAQNIYQTYVVENSPESKRLQDLNKMLIPRDSVSMALQNAQMTKDQQKFQEVVAVYDGILAEVNQQVKDFIKEDPATLSSLAAIQNLNLDQDFEYFALVIDALKGKMESNEFYKSLSDQVNAQRKLAVGSPAPDISLPQPDGQTLSLAELQGKYVLIDFWASWCGPCRKENPNVVRVYNKYHDKGFEILGVSLDKDRNSWVKAIQQDGLVWKHISDLKYWNSVVVPEYQVKGIPLTYLVDPDGNIVGKNLRGASLEDKLAEIFGD